MNMTFRWYGKQDPISLSYIRQIPGMKGIVSAVYDIQPGEVWPVEHIQALKKQIEDHGMSWMVVESVPVHEDIKMGRPSRDQYIDNYKQTIRNLALCDIRTICYNFMPVFDWTRSDLAYELEDGSTCLMYQQKQIDRMNPYDGELSLPGWDASYQPQELKNLLEHYKTIDEEILWKNLDYFVQEIMPVAQEMDVNMAIHPDDPPWNIFGLPRIIKSQENIDRFLNLYQHGCNGLTLCTGSLGPALLEQLTTVIHEHGNRIHFMHMRNIQCIGEKDFHETAHLSEYGSLDMYQIMKALHDGGFQGFIRPDHGRMIWGEQGKPGYGLYDRALGTQYLLGLWEAIDKNSLK